MQASKSIKQNQFGEDVCEGLTSNPKFLSSKYFYDDRGSQIFRRIMELPEYYLTRSEMEVFTTRTDDIFEAFQAPNTPFDLIELGAGDGTKTAVLLEHFRRRRADFSYTAIDISPQAADVLTKEFKRQFADLKIQAKIGDYLEVLKSLKSESANRKILLFLGSNIGNFSHAEAVAFLKNVRQMINPQDRLFIGFDLQKDPHLILRAYDDRDGVTAEFNLNLLARINRELGANFDLSKFSHYAIYSPLELAARSFLISLEAQKVKIESLGQMFEFKKWEPIYMEISQKYSLETISAIAAESGFRVTNNFFDSQKFYVNSLWEFGD